LSSVKLCDVIKEITMKAIVLEKTGVPDQLRLADLPDPQPGPGEVLVDLVAAGDDIIRNASFHGCGSGEKWALTIFHCPPCLTKTKVVRPWMVCTLPSLVTPVKVS